MSKARTFLAFDVPSWVCEKISTLVGDLQTYDTERQVRWATPEKFHVTLCFFGECHHADPSFRNALGDIVARSKPVALSCQGVGVFPNWKYPRVIWVGFTGETEPLMALHETMHNELREFGIHKDARAFRVHLTLGRAQSLSGKSPLVKRVESLGPMDFGDVTVDHVILYKSELTNRGAVYTALERFELG